MKSCPIARRQTSRPLSVIDILTTFPLLLSLVLLTSPFFSILMISSDTE